jgi:LuxR family maltose regulon positive regulatory protein
MALPEPYPFSDLLRQFRARAHLSQRALADRLGLHRKTIVAWEQGTYLPKYRPSIQALAEALWLSASEAAALLRAACFPQTDQIESPPEGTATAADGSGGLGAARSLVRGGVSVWQAPVARSSNFAGREDLLARPAQTLRPAPALVETKPNTDADAAVSSAYGAAPGLQGDAPIPLLATKLYRPVPRGHLVLRPQLTMHLTQGAERPLTLVSAPAGFGKTTLLAQWLAERSTPSAWLSLDAEENDPARFLAYLVAAVQTLAPTLATGVLRALQSPQPPPIAALLTTLLNELTTIPDPSILVLDDYHLIEAQAVDEALTYLVEHLPPQIHLVLATREDPPLPLARLRARGQLTELRAADLRFTPSEAAALLNDVMGLTLSVQDIARLSDRTEGWIAGLHLAAISLQGHVDPANFIQSFTGSHRFVLGYLVEEVLQQQPVSVQTFLLRTSILERMCGPLCEAVVLDVSTSGQATLESLEHANLFLVSLDHEGRWYRYHHLFAEVLQQRLHHSTQSTSSSPEGAESQVNALHRRASQWYEAQGLELEAFHHAAAANDVERAERLIEGRGMPLHFRGAVAPVLNWLKSLPTTELDAWPALWTAYASTLLATGQTTGVEEKLQAAEKALQDVEPDDKTQDLVGRIAAIRATIATHQNQVETIIAQSYRALEYLHPNNLAFRTSTAWKLGYASQLQGDRAAARRAYTDVIALGQASGNTMYTLMATIGLGQVQEADNQLHLSTQTYRGALHLLGDHPLPILYEAHLGLARICYEWNDLEAAERHAQQSIHLARQVEHNDRFVAGEVMLARLKLAEGDVAGAADLLSEASQSLRRQNFVSRMPEVAAAQVLTFLRKGQLAAAAHLAETYDLALSQARVHLARQDPDAALAVLARLRAQVEAKGWADERLKVLLLEALVLQAQGHQDQAVQQLWETLALAESAGFIRSFVDEGPPMAHLLATAAAEGLMPDYLGKLLSACEAEAELRKATSSPPPAQPLIEPLSHREVEVLQLIAQGLSNQEICERLFLALSTVKGHTRNIVAGQAEAG